VLAGAPDKASESVPSNAIALSKPVAPTGDEVLYPVYAKAWTRYIYALTLPQSTVKVMDTPVVTGAVNILCPNAHAVAAPEVILEVHSSDAESSIVIESEG
jgi:hypothetical protein